MFTSDFGQPTQYVTGQTALGSTQATAVPLVGNFCFSEFAVVPSGTGAVLPNVPSPAVHEVINDGANALLVYPPVGGTVAGGGVNAPFSLSANSMGVFWLAGPSTWKLVP